VLFLCVLGVLGGLIFCYQAVAQPRVGLLEFFQHRLRLAELELSQAKERFVAGVAGSVETTNAQGGLVAARDGLIQARVNAAVARVSVRRALGVLDQTP